MFSPRPLPADG